MCSANQFKYFEKRVSFILLFQRSDFFICELFDPLDAFFLRVRDLFSIASLQVRRQKALGNILIVNFVNCF